MQVDCSTSLLQVSEQISVIEIQNMKIMKQLLAMEKRRNEDNKELRENIEKMRKDGEIKENDPDGYGENKTNHNKSTISVSQSDEFKVSIFRVNVV